MKIVRLGIIGLGYIGQVHLMHALKFPDAQVVGVADVSKSALRRARDNGVKMVFTDYEELLKYPDIDAVVIALPTHLHARCATKVAQSGKHIFLEKPLARNVAEGQEIVTAARQNSVNLMIGYPLRFNSSFRNLKRQIDRRDLGDVEIAYATYLSSGPFFHRAEGYAPVPVPEWWFDRNLTGGGALVDSGSHLINLLRWYFGEITDVKSSFGYRFNMDFEDSATCLIKFNSGTKAVLIVGWFIQGFQLKVELFGTARCVEARQPTQNPIVTAAQVLTTGTSKFYQAHVAELQHFVNCLTTNSKPSPSGEEGLKDLEAISLAYKNQIRI